MDSSVDLLDAVTRGEKKRRKGDRLLVDTDSVRPIPLRPPPPDLRHALQRVANE
jgi:hypothetical protein